MQNQFQEFFTGWFDDAHPTVCVNQKQLNIHFVLNEETIPGLGVSTNSNSVYCSAFAFTDGAGLR